MTYWLFTSGGVLIAIANGYMVLSGLMVMTAFGAMKLAARTEAATHEAIQASFSRQTPDKVWVMANGAEVEVPFTSLKAGDVVIVNAGQTIPVDGLVCAGEGAVDQQTLTGEARPVEKFEGEPALANTLLMSGRLLIQVERAGQETTAAQVATILTDAANFQLEATQKSERIADKLVIPMIATSAAAWATVGPAGSVALLNSGYGSKMIIAGPLTVLTYLDKASQEGVLIKDGRALEALAQVSAVVFDKTGTLTQEEPVVADVLSLADELSRHQVLRFAALAEYRQTHPIAKAILRAASQEGIASTPPDDASYSIGMGIAVRLDGQSVLVGSARFLASHDIQIPAAADDLRAQAMAEGGSVVFVAHGGRCVGALRLEAQLREDAAQTVRLLLARGTKVYILSGDHEAPTRHLAEKLGVTGYFAEVMPQDKARVVTELQRRHKVCFVGDGINDALALRQADVSISMRGATTLATDSAQIVLMGASLRPMARLLELSESFTRNLNRTLRFCYLPTAVLVGGVFILHFGVGAALALYSSGLLGAVGNAMAPRLLEKSDPALLSGPRAARSRFSGKNGSGPARGRLPAPPPN